MRLMLALKCNRVGTPATLGANHPILPSILDIALYSGAQSFTPGWPSPCRTIGGENRCLSLSFRACRLVIRILRIRILILILVDRTPMNLAPM
jgi:hypothetical protein